MCEPLQGVGGSDELTVSAPTDTSDTAVADVIPNRDDVDADRDTIDHPKEPNISNLAAEDTVHIVNEEREILEPSNSSILDKSQPEEEVSHQNHEDGDEENISNSPCVDGHKTENSSEVSVNGEAPVSSSSEVIQEPSKQVLITESKNAVVEKSESSDFDGRTDVNNSETSPSNCAVECESNQSEAGSVNDEEKGSTTSQGSFDSTKLQQQALEATIARLRRELNEAQSRLTEHDASAKRTIMTMQNDMRVRLDNLGRLCEDNRKEKESMVLKYAQAEQKTMDIQRRVKDLEGRLREAQREKEGLVKQSRVLRQEKDRFQGIYENKCTEMANLEKELLIAKDANSSVDMKVKWHQNKLKEESDRHKDTKKKLEETQKTLSNLKEETETIRANCQQIIKKYQEAEEARKNTLGEQLKQKEHELKQTQAENYVQQEVHQKAVKDLEVARKSARESGGELRTLRDKVKCLEAERMCQEEAASQAKERAMRMKVQRDQLAEKVRNLEASASDAAEKAAQLEQITAELEAMKEKMSDLESETERAKGRETELLEFTQRLSDRNAALQAENLTQKTSLTELNAEFQTLTADLEKAMKTVSDQERKLSEIQSSHTTEAEELTRTLTEKTRTCEELSVMLADERNEIRTLKKKHTANTKDLTRQLAACRRKLEIGHSPLGMPLQPAPEENSVRPSNGEHHTSPSSSTSSLDIHSTAICVDGGAAYPSAEALRTFTTEVDPSATPEIKMIMPDRQALIDKIVRLQKTNARHNEKMDFMAEHVNQLTDQLKRKNRLLQHFILREEPGSVTPEDFDLNKAALAKKGGIMASVYSSHAADQGMTLDLSLEITRKLQQVLEDTLLKNITLKDNLNTLGEEISRLSRENRELQLVTRGSS